MIMIKGKVLKFVFGSAAVGVSAVGAIVYNQYVSNLSSEVENVVEARNDSLVVTSEVTSEAERNVLEIMSSDLDHKAEQPKAEQPKA